MLLLRQKCKEFNFANHMTYTFAVLYGNISIQWIQGCFLVVVIVVVFFLYPVNQITSCIHLSNHTKVPFQNVLFYQMVSINIDKLKKVFEQSL